MPSKRFTTCLTKSILRKSLKSSSYICLALAELGEITLESFFNPKYSFTRPSRRLLGLDPQWQPNKNTLKGSLRRLINQGIVEKEKNKISLTKTGKRLISSILAKQNVLNKKWDGKYRLVIFDIPESKKRSRDWLREELYLLNYIQLQKSVFIGKHPLAPNIIKDIKKNGIGHNVNYLLVDKIYDARKLKVFHLP